LESAEKLNIDLIGALALVFFHGILQANLFLGPYIIHTPRQLGLS
jgi:hypothetical protein